MTELPVLPVNSQERKRIPLCTGVYDYFAAALAEVAKVSMAGNEKHNPGQPLHWSREKSADHADCCARHLMERGGFDEVHLPDGRVVKLRHTAELAWRSLALLQEELEAAGEAPPSRGSTLMTLKRTEPQQPRVDGGPICVPPEPDNVLLCIVTCNADLKPHAKSSSCVNPRLASGAVGLIRGPHEASLCSCSACGHAACPAICDCAWCDR